MGLKTLQRIVAGLTLAFATVSPALANDNSVEIAFDNVFGTELRTPPVFQPDFDDPLAIRIARLADGGKGRIGVAALDLSTGREIAILGEQRFPMASTSKIAIAATYLEGVDRGRWSLTSEYPLLLPVSSQPFSTSVAPVRKGNYLSARELIDLMLTRSSNSATDALLAAVGGPRAVNDWARRAGVEDFDLNRDIATLVRDDGEVDPAVSIDVRDSATPKAMVQLLSGLYQGRWLSASSRDLLIGTMEKCRTGTRRIPALMPGNVTVAHKTGSLNNTSSDVGILTAPDGRSIALAIYVTGQGSRANREAKIASIARALYDGYTVDNGRQWVNASY